MNLRVEQWMVLGIGVIGGVAVYRMLTSPPELPSSPGPVVVPAGSTVISGDPIGLGNQHWYGGRFEEGSFDPVAFGFSAPMTYATPAEANGHVPAFTLANPGTNTRWFVAHWLHDTASIARPPGLTLLWQTFAPQAAHT